MSLSKGIIEDMTKEELEREIERIEKEGKENELAVLPALKNVLDMKTNEIL
jgi:hypothetical protein